MHTALFSHAVVWVWLVAALAAIAFVGALFVVSFRETDDEFAKLTVGLLAQQAAIGLAFLALHNLGHPATAQWLWRILGPASVLAAFTVWVRSVRRSSFGRFEVDGETAAFLAAVLCSTLLVIASFFVDGAFFTPTTSAGVTTAANFTWSAQTAINAALITAFVLLALLTLTFTWLFLAVVRRDGGLSLEFIDSGIGGGSRIGRVPASVSYALGMVLAGGCLLMLLRHEEVRIFTPPPPPPASKTDAPQPPSNPATNTNTNTPTQKPTATHPAKPAE